MAYLDTIAKKRIGILGLGVSGLACVSFLMKFRIKPFVMDNNPRSNGIKVVKSGWPHIKVREQLPEKVDMLIVSPGIDLSSDTVLQAKAKGAEIIGDVELFARINQKPLIAITGTNGKSTVTRLVTEMLQNAGIHAVMGGNIGVPVLSLLNAPLDVAVIELSSFQLESTSSLNGHVATVLNCEQDHMDRYEGFDQYIEAKHRIYHGAQWLVYNREDESTWPLHRDERNISFGLDAPSGDDYGIKGGYFARGEQLICPLESLKLLGSHNVANALAAIALVRPFDVDNKVIAQTLGSFEGLPHRCELVLTHDGVRFINDSKATNVGATIAALSGLAPQCKGRMILLAGGIGKEQHFAPLKPVLAQYVDTLITFGQDGEQIAALVDEPVKAASLEEAVAKAVALAEKDDCVLLSPACASFDMFANFEQRGERFAQLAREACHVH